MAILILAEIEPTDTWFTRLIAALKERKPNVDLRVWPNYGQPEDIDIVLVWCFPEGAIQRFSNLKLILSLGAGVDHILQESSLPIQVPIVRSVYNQLPLEMAEYVTLAILSFKRRLLDYQNLQRSHRWQQLSNLHDHRLTVGILGLGVLGSIVAQKLTNLDLSVRGWSRSPKSIEAVQCFYGHNQFKPFLSRCHVIVCLLPLTVETKGILSKELFAALPQGAYLVNVGRGQHLVEADLLNALESGQLAGACLDVFETEPLLDDHPFWSHPRITVTPHIACISQPDALADYIFEKIAQLENGKILEYLVDRDRGY